MFAQASRQPTTAVFCHSDLTKKDARQDSEVGILVTREAWVNGRKTVRINRKLSAEKLLLHCIDSSKGMDQVCSKRYDVLAVQPYGPTGLSGIHYQAHPGA